MPAISVRTNAAPGSSFVGNTNSRSARGALNVSRTEALALGITPGTLLKRDWMFNVELAPSYQAAQGEVVLLRGLYETLSHMRQSFVLPGSVARKSREDGASTRPGQRQAARIDVRIDTHGLCRNLD